MTLEHGVLATHSLADLGAVYSKYLALYTDDILSALGVNSCLICAAFLRLALSILPR